MELSDDSTTMSPFEKTINPFIRNINFSSLKFRLNNCKEPKPSKTVALNSSNILLSLCKYYVVDKDVTMCFNKIEKCTIKHDFYQTDDSKISLYKVKSNRFEFYFNLSKKSNLKKFDNFLYQLPKYKSSIIYLSVGDLFTKNNCSYGWIIDISKHFKKIQAKILDMPNYAIQYLFFIDREYSKYKEVEFICEKDDDQLFLGQIDKLVQTSNGEFTAKFTFKNKTIF